MSEAVSSESLFELYQAGEAPCSSARGLAEEARAAGKAAAVVMVVDSPESRKIMAKRRHDLKAARRTLEFTVDALKSGYTFQDAAAKAKIEAIEKAVAVLARETSLVLRLFPE